MRSSLGLLVLGTVRPLGTSERSGCGRRVFINWIRGINGSVVSRMWGAFIRCPGVGGAEQPARDRNRTPGDGYDSMGSTEDR